MRNVRVSVKQIGLATKLWYLPHMKYYTHSPLHAYTDAERCWNDHPQASTMAEMLSVSNQYLSVSSSPAVSPTPFIGPHVQVTEPGEYK